MKQQVEPKNPLEVASAFPLTSLLAGWYFRVREVSPGQFIAEGTDLWGRKVSHQSGDSQVALNRCVSSARLVMLLVRFGAAYVIFCRLFCCAILCFFAYIPASIAWWILSKSVAKPGEINLYTFVGLGISFTGLYFFVLLIYRALTGRGRKEDGGLLPPWAINLFVAAFGVMALLIVMFGIYSGKLPAVLGGISYFCIALAVWSARRNQRARGRFRA